METNHSMSAEEENRRKQLGESVIVLERWFLKWSDAFPTYEVTNMQMAVYAEALDDLTLQRLELGCKEATRVAEQFPKPGHIRKALEEFEAKHYRENSVLGPKQLHYRPVSQEEREGALEFSKLLRELIAQQSADEKTKRDAPIELPFSRTSDFEERLEGYKGWLTKQAEKDLNDVAAGINPVPRSRAEREAIMWTMPPAQRKRLQKAKYR